MEVLLVCIKDHLTDQLVTAVRQFPKLANKEMKYSLKRYN